MVNTESKSVKEQPERPPSMPVLFDQVPADITAIAHWVLWGWRWNKKRSKWDKPPLQPTGRLASSTDPKTWLPWATAITFLRTFPRKFDGVGFVLSSDVGIVGIDLDDCRDPATGIIREPAASIIRKMDSYAEVSPSGTGVKLLIKGKLPDKAAKVNHQAGIEIYDNGRYFTITGHRIDPATL